MASDSCNGASSSHFFCIYYHKEHNVWWKKHDCACFIFSEQKEIPNLWTTLVKIFKIIKHYRGSCIFCWLVMDELQLSPGIIITYDLGAFEDLCWHLCSLFKHFFFWWLLLKVMPFLMGSVAVSLLWSSNPSALIALLSIANIWSGPITSLLSSLSIISAWQLCGTIVVFPSWTCNFLLFFYI